MKLTAPLANLIVNSPYVMYSCHCLYIDWIDNEKHFPICCSGGIGNPGIAWPTFRLLCIFTIYLMVIGKENTINKGNRISVMKMITHFFCEIPEDTMYKDEVQNDHFSDNSGKQLQRAQKCRSELVHY